METMICFKYVLQGNSKSKVIQRLESLGEKKKKTQETMQDEVANRHLCGEDFSIIALFYQHYA